MTSSSRGTRSAELRARIAAILDQSRVLALATLRPDGWPQATLVGYVRDGLTLYFAVARNSQKLANVGRDPRVSIALGRETPRRVHGLSMAALVEEVLEPIEVERLNRVIGARYREQVVFAPREVGAALLRAEPRFISIFDDHTGPGAPLLVEVGDDGELTPRGRAPD